MDDPKILFHLLPTIGFLLALVILAKIVKERRPPTSTLAWLLAIIFIPHLGVPLYLIFGGRKMTQKAESKPQLSPNTPSASFDTCGADTTYLIASERGVFPPSAPNRVTLLPEGRQAWETLLARIQGARHTVYIATFILGRDETGRALVQALAKKAAEGLEVCLLLDAVGSLKVTKSFLAPLVAAGGQVAFFMPMIHWPFRGRANLRNHRKIVVCDGTAAVIGGMNLASEYMGPRESLNRWQDLSLSVEGPVTNHITEIFRSDWTFASKRPLRDHDPVPETGGADCSGLSQLVASGPDVPNDSLRHALLTNIFRARQRVWITTPYFIPDELFLEALYIAASRKVQVVIIVPKKSNHRLADIVREGYLTRLQEAGVEVLLYEPCMLHAKTILIDDTLAIVGSANMDMRSMLLNYEIALCLYDKETIKQLETWMLDKQAHCSVRELLARKSFALIEGVSRLFAPLL